MASATIAMQPVGAIEMADLAGICDLQGRDGLPYPFVATGNAPLSFRHLDFTDTTAVAERFTHGDLRVFTDWANAYNRADIWVECRVLCAAGPAARMLAYRAGRTGFFASQRQDTDVVDVYTLPAVELGPAIASRIAPTTPGAHQRIVVPGYLDYFTGPARQLSDEEFYANFSVLRPVMSPTGPRSTTVPNTDVSASAIIQSRCQPARDWGVDRTKNFVVWLRVTNDGDYLYAPDFSHATPATQTTLAERIDRLIAADAALRHQRGLD